MSEMMGTREAKDIIMMNGGIRIGSLICKACKRGYKIIDNECEILKTRKLDIALDWLVENEYLYETRFRLTAEQKHILRQRIWEYIGCIIMCGVAFSVAMIIIVAWLLGSSIIIRLS